MGAAIVGIWTLSRILFSRRVTNRVVTATKMPPRRRLLLVLLSASLIPIYLYYFTGILDAFSVALPAWVIWLGDALLAASVALFVWCHASLGASWSANVEYTAGQRLVTTGPYKAVRHPMYSALIMMAIALWPATGNVVASLPYSLAIVVLYFDRFADEEQLMLESFGKPYAEYMSRTGRLLPRLGDRADA